MLFASKTHMCNCSFMTHTSQWDGARAMFAPTLRYCVKQTYHQNAARDICSAHWHGFAATACCTPASHPFSLRAWPVASHKQLCHSSGAPSMVPLPVRDPVPLTVRWAQVLRQKQKPERNHASTAHDTHASYRLQLRSCRSNTHATNRFLLEAVASAHTS
jgi:hypothetical protein